MPHGILLEDHLDRFDFYTRLIKKFDLVEELYDSVSPIIISFITLYRQLKTFPILQTLKLDLGGKPIKYISFLFLLASDTLSKVAIEGVKPSNEFFVASLLHVFSIRSLLLLDLHLDGAFTKTTLDMLPNFKRLRNLNITSETGHLALDFFLHIAQLEHLTSLRLNFWMDIQTPGLLTNGKLRALETLEILGSLYTTLRILDSISTSQLTYLEITSDSDTSFSVDNPEPHMRSIFSRICCIAPNLQGFFFLPGRWDDGVLRMPSLCLRDILSCKHLRQIDHPLDVLTTEVLAALESAGGEWPAMEYICLDGDLGTFGRSPLLLSQIEPFVALFPNLKELEIPLSLKMDSNEIERMKICLRTRSPCHKLQSLCLTSVMSCDMSADGVKQCNAEYGPLTGEATYLLVICQFIDYIFPYLKALSTGLLPNYVDRNWCKGLEAGVKALQMSRMSGRVE